MVKLKIETHEPKVGIFWFLGTELIEFSTPARDQPQVQGFVDSPFDHADKWQEIQKVFPQLRNKDYTFLPRGRVIYAGPRKRFEVITSKAIAFDKSRFLQVCRKFSLPISAAVVADEHYE